MVVIVVTTTSGSVAVLLYIVPILMFLNYSCFIFCFYSLCFRYYYACLSCLVNTFILFVSNALYIIITNFLIIAIFSVTIIIYLRTRL